MNIRSFAPALAAFALAGAVASAQVTKSEVPGITNFSRVDATIGCGGATTPAAMPALKKEGFKSVINLRLATEQGAEIDASRRAAEGAGLKYIHLPFDTAKPDPKLVDSFLASVADKANQPVYIHCGSANRVAAMWMIKRTIQDKWEIDKAVDEAEQIGLTNVKLKDFAITYILEHQP